MVRLVYAGDHNVHALRPVSVDAAPLLRKGGKGEVVVQELTELHDQAAHTH